MGRPGITQDEWDRRAAAAGLEWLESVSGSAAPTLARCLECSHEWSPWPTNVNSGHGCPNCAAVARGVALTLPQDEWDRRAAARGLEWLEAVRSALTPTLARCLECSHGWSPWPANVNSGHGCPKCAGVAIGVAQTLPQAEWDRRAAAAGLEWLEPVTGSRTPTVARCLACGREYSAFPDAVRRGHGCSRCTVSHEEWDRRAAVVGIEWIEAYQRSDRPRRARCLTCGTEFAPQPRSVAEGSGCPTCATTGLDRTKPGTVYLIQHDDPLLMKVGVMNTGGRRLAEHRSRGWQVVCTWDVHDGYEAERIESTTISWWSKLGGRFADRDDVPARDGYTETVHIGKVDVTDTLDFIVGLLDAQQE